jgi:phosphoglycerate dehydrogenase-like enzyme
MSNSSSVFEEPCAEHALAFMLAGARDFVGAWGNQSGARGWPQEKIRNGSRLMTGQTVVILGYGTIGERLAEMLGPMRMTIHGFRRTVRGDEAVATHSLAEVDSFLPMADHVVNILPGHASTNGFMSAARFGKMKRGAMFYNIGRGTTVDQNALLEALRSGQIAQAFLDVTDPEPLPAEHPLWGAENCFITPHTAGGHVDEFERTGMHFLGNLKRFERGEDLLDRIMG